MPAASWFFIASIGTELTALWLQRLKKSYCLPALEFEPTTSQPLVKSLPNLSLPTTNTPPPQVKQCCRLSVTTRITSCKSAQQPFSPHKTESLSTYPEGHLQVLPSPDVHALIVRSHLIEVVTFYGKQTTSHRGGPETHDNAPTREKAPTWKQALPWNHSAKKLPILSFPEIAVPKNITYFVSAKHTGKTTSWCCFKAKMKLFLFFFIAHMLLNV